MDRRQGGDARASTSPPAPTPSRCMPLLVRLRDRRREVRPTFSTHSARASGALVCCLPGARNFVAGLHPRPFSLMAAQLGSPEMASLKLVAHARAADSAASALPGHTPLPSALAKLARSFDSAFSRHFGSTPVPPSTAFARHWACANRASAAAFAFASAHFTSGGTRAKRLAAALSSRRTTIPMLHSDLDCLFRRRRPSGRPYRRRPGASTDFVAGAQCRGAGARGEVSGADRCRSRRGGGGWPPPISGTRNGS